MSMSIRMNISFKSWLAVFTIMFTLLLIGIICSANEAYAATYYVSTSGSDSNNGTTSTTPWQTLTKVSSITFSPGDSIFLKAGDTWSSQYLDLKGNGSPTNWITLSSYGTGNKPKIYPYSSQAAIPAPDPSNINNGILTAIRLKNTAGWKILGLEIAYVKTGILYTNETAGTRNGLWIENCYIHDITKWPVTPFPQDEDRVADLQIMPYSVGIFTFLKDGSPGVRLQNVTIKNITFQYTDAPLEIRHADNVAIDAVTATDSYREGIILTGINYNYDGTPVGSLTNSTILRTGSNGMVWGTTGLAFNAVHKFTADSLDIGFTVSPNSPDGVGIDYEGLNSNVTVQNSYIHDNEDEAVMYYRNPFWSGTVDNLNTSLINNIFSNNGIKTDGIPHSAFLVHGFNQNNGGTISGNTIIKASSTQTLNMIDERTPKYWQFMPKSYIVSNNTVMLKNGNIIHYASTEFGNTQGLNGWSYLVNGTQANVAWENAISTAWEKGDWNVAGSVAYIGDNWVHPDVGKEITRKWVAPSGKRLEIIGAAYKLDTGGGDGVEVRIVKNNDSTPLWSGTLAFNDSTGVSHDIKVDVAAGDTISFITNAKASSSNDKVAWDPEIIDLNSQTILTGQIPTTFMSNNQAELGDKLKTSVAGTISKVRIYTNASESGNHTVRIWRVSDNTVLSGPFTWSIASGTADWKEFVLPTPLKIAANTDYIVSVSNSTDKIYAWSDYGFNSPINNGDLITYSGSGVFSTTMGSMPADTYHNSNYFRDVVFTPFQTVLTSQIPGTYMSDVQAEFGTRFKTSVAGTIPKVRIYTNATESGVHSVRIWRVSDGTVLAGPYAWSIASGTAGWKEFSLPAALSISANTEYIVSVSNSTDKYYAWSDYGFNSPVINGNLVSYTGSGVFTTTLGTLPASTYHNSNYFRDILFEPN